RGSKKFSHVTVYPINVLLDIFSSQVLLTETENDLQIKIYSLQTTCQKYDMKISTSSTKTMDFSGKCLVGTKIGANDEVLV
ncbi:unnamed protein product, partial [Callosobruchus maculatus]